MGYFQSKSSTRQPNPDKATRYDRLARHADEVVGSALHALEQRARRVFLTGAHHAPPMASAPLIRARNGLVAGLDHDSYSDAAEAALLRSRYEEPAPEYGLSRGAAELELEAQRRHGLRDRMVGR